MGMHVPMLEIIISMTCFTVTSNVPKRPSLQQGPYSYHLVLIIVLQANNHV